jgi:hypothetical protein
MNHTEYSEINNGSLSNEHMVIDTESLQVVPVPRSCCESELRCYHKYVTTRNLVCLFVLMQLILLMLWAMNYEIIWYSPDGSMSGSGSGSGSGYYEEERIPTRQVEPVEPVEPVVDYVGPAHSLFASSELAEYSYKGLPEKNDPNNQDKTNVGQSSDEFVQFLGMILFIYICVRCTCGRNPYRK